MGAAFGSMGNRLPGCSVTVLGSASSTRPELTGIALALEASHSGDPTCSMSPVEQLHHVSDELSAGIPIERERKIRPTEAEERGHSHE